MKQTLLVLLIAAIGFAAGFMVEYQLLPKEAPLPSALLENPVIDELYADAEGIVIAKNEDSITLDKSGRQIIMYMEEGAGITLFSWQSNHSLRMDFSEVKIGDSLKGGVSIVVLPESTRGLSKSRNIGDMIANRFLVSR